MDAPNGGLVLGLGRNSYRRHHSRQYCTLDGLLEKVTADDVNVRPCYACIRNNSINVNESYAQARHEGIDEGTICFVTSTRR